MAHTGAEWAALKILTVLPGLSRYFLPKACAALAGLLALVAISSPLPAEAFTLEEAKAPMTVTLVRSDAGDCGTNCPEWLALTGQIVPETPALSRAALGRLGRRSVPVLVDSPGGAVEAAMMMGRMIRERHLDVAVAGTAVSACAAADRACLTRARTGERPGYVAGGIAACASACVLLLAAGTDRSVGQNSFVGVHQIVMRKMFKRVINTFRIMRKVVDGHVVEVSRTLIASRPVSTHIVQMAATEQKYSEVDRYVLEMGIGESIMPLMHGTPPSGMHWMTPIELATTRIATDTTDARTLVARSLLLQDKTPAQPAEPEPASLTLASGAHEEGTVRWSLGHAAATGADALSLAAEIDLPGRHLHGSLSIARNTDPARAASFTIAASLLDRDMAAIGAPKVCDAEACPPGALGGRFIKWTASDYVFWVAPAEGDRLLSALRDRNRLALPVRFFDGGAGELGLTLSGAGRRPILDWEHLCCGLAAK